MAFVPSASAFSLPLLPWQQNSSLRVARYESRKRKKHHDAWDDDTDYGFDGETTDAASEAAPPAPSLTLSPEEIRQYRLAGLSFDQEIPGGPFPHGPLQDEKPPANTRSVLLKELSALSTPLYPPQSAAYQGSLRVNHLSVLTTIMHRCLLQGDYIRAGRAWGLIIREQFDGRPVDVRSEDRWGIGAEILLRKDRQKAVNALEGKGDVKNAQKSGTSPQLYFTKQGFEDAKAYYETLIIQHPYQKTVPNGISALQFYPAMFGLWIYVTQEESNAERKTFLDRQEETWDDEDAGSELESDRNSRQRTQALVAGVRAKELAQAQRIAARMDEMIVSPPYSDSPELLELRGMISLWIADLFVSSLPSGQKNSYDDYDNDYDDDVSMSAEELPDSIQERRERRLAMEKRQAEIGKAGGYMEKAQQRKQGVTSRLEGLHIDDDMSTG